MANEATAPLEEFAENAADSFNQWWDKTFELKPLEMLIFIGIVAVISFLVIKLLKRFLLKKLTGNMKIFYRLIYIIIIIIAVVSVLMTIKPLQEFSGAILASSGIAAAVLGLAAQQTLGNLFSGISISANKPFVAGEFIEILDTNPPISGIVESIGLRHTTLRDPSNRTIVIPNSVMDKEMLRTTHYLEGTNVNNFIYVGISYDADIDLAIELLVKIISGHANAIDMRTYEERENEKPR
jgi:small-conductance mechanosensitive channel